MQSGSNLSSSFNPSCATRVPLIQSPFKLVRCLKCLTSESPRRVLFSDSHWRLGKPVTSSNPVPEIAVPFNWSLTRSESPLSFTSPASVTAVQSRAKKRSPERRPIPSKSRSEMFVFSRCRQWSSFRDEGRRRPAPVTRVPRRSTIRSRKPRDQSYFVVAERRVVDSNRAHVSEKVVPHEFEEPSIDRPLGDCHLQIVEGCVVGLPIVVHFAPGAHLFNSQRLLLRRL